MSTKLVILLTFCLAIPISADVESFVYEKMHDFPAYIQQKNLDPTPVDEATYHGYQDNVTVSMETELSKLVISGYSTHIYPEDVVADLTDGLFYIYLRSKAPFTAIGMHQTNWTVAGNHLRSQGQWNSHLSEVYFDQFYVSYSVLPSGYLTLTYFTSYPWQMKWFTHNVTFERISGNDAGEGHEACIDSALGILVRRYFERVGKTVANTLEQFWREILSNTTLEEVIGHTGIYNPSSTTTYPISTTDPCALNANNVEERILESKVVEKENGDLVRVTLMVKTEKLGKEKHYLGNYQHYVRKDFFWKPIN